MASRHNLKHSKINDYFLRESESWPMMNSNITLTHTIMNAIIAWNAAVDV